MNPMPTLLPMALTLLAWADPPQGPAAAPPLSVVEAVEAALADAIAAAEPSVVAVAREKSDNDETLAVRGRAAPRPPVIDRRFGVVAQPNADPFAGDNPSFDYGSGVVVGGHNEILTAYHVVKGAKALRVRAANRQEFLAEVIAADPRSDLAVIAPREGAGGPPVKLKPIRVGDAARLRKGNFLVALGNPFNAARDGHPSASWGILANVARKLEQTYEEQLRGESQLRYLPTLLQLDSKLNLGMSGGAVINLKGELVGLTTSAANAAGFDAQAGYAIPMDRLVRNVVETLKQGKEYEYGFLGINLDIPNGTTRVETAKAGTPAALGGVLAGDYISAVGDTPVSDSDGLVVAINSVPAGEPVVLKIRRKDAEIERTVVLAKRGIRGPVIATNRPDPWRGLRTDYTSVQTGMTFPPDLLDAMSREGVLVTEVESGSASEKSGLRTGQVVSRVDGAPVKNPREFAKAVAGKKGPVKLETDAGTFEVN